MAITEEDLDELIEPKGDIQKLSSISSDGKNLVTRVPKDLVDELNISKGDKFEWVLNKNENTISLSVSGAGLATLDDGK